MSSDFYAVLHVTHESTQKEIEEAFENATKGLNPHSSDPHILHQYYVYKEAYDVLSNPNAKERYDYFNDNTSSTEQSSYNHTDSKISWYNLYNSLTHSGTKERLALGSICTIVLVLLFISLFFAALRLDNYVTWSWLIVLIPTWILVGSAFLVSTCIAIISSEGMVDESKSAKLYRKWRALYIFVIALLSVIQFLLVYFKVGDVIEWLYIYISIPYIIIYILFCIRKIVLVVCMISPSSSLWVLFEDSICFLCILSLCIWMDASDNNIEFASSILAFVLLFFLIKIIRVSCSFPACTCRQSKNLEKDVSDTASVTRGVAMLFVYIALFISSVLAFLELYAIKTITFIIVFLPLFFAIIIAFVSLITALCKASQQYEMKLHQKSVTGIIKTMQTVPEIQGKQLRKTIKATKV
ncbi:hypothetical protein WA158_006208 [Blastocystis sp. Blastoise]